MIVELKDYKVEIKDAYTWGDKEQIQASLMSGAKINDATNGGFSFDTDAMLESKYKALECAVVSIKEGDKEVEWTKEWQNNLSVEDGDTLMSAVDGITKKKKA